MHSHDVSVIIPTYNRLAFLKEAINSVIRQTLPAKEIIVVDDGSTDGTLDWLKSENNPSLKYFSQAQKGPAAARNLGVSQASSNYIALLDSDDEWLEEKLKYQVEFLSTHPEYQFCQTEEIWYRDQLRIHPKKYHQKPSGDVFVPCLKLCLISPSAVMLRRDFFEELGGFDESFPVCEDYELWLRAALISPFVTLPNPLTIKRGGHIDQLSKKHWGMDRFRVMAMEKILWNYSLKADQQRALLAELFFKLEVLAKGFSKRFSDQTNPYQEKIHHLQERFLKHGETYENCFSHS